MMIHHSTNIIYMPTTAYVLELIGAKGVIVGSWPKRREDAKDVDVVIAERRAEDDKHPIFEKIKRKVRDDFIESSAPGHLWVNALPKPVEIFEGTRHALESKEKALNVLSYHEAKRRAIWINCYGTEVRAVAL